ncbi:Hypothetical predicted protein [Cloeon dipterum]|uniref:BTB domain-containing protein n=1 Tax=Cloeon dipterum TaxID=197152 RepID=A0A8S1E1I3_9INSE|nr:Hypothetical predicted protein [Cloeon dipterum]
MMEILDEWEIFKTLSDELKRNIRLAFVIDNSAIYVTKDDNVFGFGKNEEGFLGTGDMKSRTVHTKIEQLCGQNIQGLQFSKYTFFAISGSGSVFAWGRNYHGQLGLGTKQRTLIPTKIEGILGTKRVVQVACSSWHTLVLTSDREVVSFGFNHYGQLGLGHSDGQTRAQTLPKKLDFPAAGKVVTAIACLDLSSVALLDSGEVFAWGKNEYSILGYRDDDLEERNIPRKVPGLEGIAIRRIVCGKYHALALSNDGKVYSWGWNRDVQHGTGTFKDTHRPTLISGNCDRILDVAAHFESSVSAAVTEGNEVYLWGWFNDQKFRSPTKTSFKSLDEVFANIGYKALTFRPLRPKRYEPIQEKNIATEWPKNYFDDADTADVVFVVEGKKIHAHKTILMKRCDFFRAIEESNQREKIIEYYSFEAFYAFLKYFYTNEVDLNPDLLFELITLADFYEMPDLRKECLEIAQRDVLSVVNARANNDDALQLDVEEFKKFVLKFCKENNI